MKELRSFGGYLRALFAFDPKRRAIVLLGGDKRGYWRGWYERNSAECIGGLRLTGAAQLAQLES